MRTGQVYLDFRRKIVFKFIDNKDKLCFSDIVPATIVETEVFENNFSNLGIYQCSFKQFKKFHNFNGRDKKSREYGIIRLDKRQFTTLYEYDKKDLGIALNKILNELSELRIYKENEKRIETDAKKFMKKWFSYLPKAMEEIEKQTIKKR